MTKTQTKRRVSKTSKRVSAKPMNARTARVAEKASTKKPAAAKVAARAKANPAPTRDAVDAPVLRDVNQKLKIKILAEGNPRREGTEPHDHWKKFVKDGMSVEDFLDKGGNWLHLRADIARGHVKLVT